MLAGFTTSLPAYCGVSMDLDVRTAVFLLASFGGWILVRLEASSRFAVDFVRFAVTAMVLFGLSFAVPLSVLLIFCLAVVAGAAVLAFLYLRHGFGRPAESLVAVSAMACFLGYGLGIMPPFGDGSAYLAYHGFASAPSCGASIGFPLRCLYVGVLADIAFAGRGFAFGRALIVRMILWVLLVAIMAGWLHAWESGY